MKTLRTVLLLLLLAAPTACGEPSAEGALRWGGAGDVKQYYRLYIAGQPDAAGLAAARDAGVGIVIDLRDPSEHDWDEAAAAAKLGLDYHNVPVSGRALSRDAMERIHAIVQENPDEEILLHCASGNRAAAWLAIHLVENEGMDAEEALAIGRETGLTKDSIAENVSAYLEQPGS
jgi:uncharacterized protein (TIGR01244 family)